MGCRSAVEVLWRGSRWYIERGFVVFDEPGNIGLNIFGVHTIGRCRAENSKYLKA